DQTARLWDVATGRSLFTLTEDWDHRHALRAEGTALLAALGPNRIGLRDLVSGRQLGNWKIADTPANRYANCVLELGLSPDGRSVTSISDDNDAGRGITVVVKDVTTGKTLVRRPHLPVRASATPYHPVLSPDRRTVAEPDWDAINLCDVATGRQLQTLRAAQ